MKDGTIETTKKVFDLIFSSTIDYTHSETKEKYNKHFYNSDEQKGILLHNFINDIFQYYLIDINY